MLNVEKMSFGDIFPSLSLALLANRITVAIISSIICWELSVPRKIMLVLVAVLLFIMHIQAYRDGSD